MKFKNYMIHRLGIHSIKKEYLNKISTNTLFKLISDWNKEEIKHINMKNKNDKNTILFFILLSLPYLFGMVYLIIQYFK